MTISTENRTAGPFVGNDAATIFPFNYKVFTAEDLLVVQTVALTSASTTLQLTADYTVTLNGDQNANPGGTVNLLVPLASGCQLVLASQLEYLQPLELTNSGGFYPKVINDAFDRVTILLQQLFSTTSRALRFPISDTGTNTELPQRSARANKLLSFDDNGNPIAVAVAAQSATALQVLLSGAAGAGIVGVAGAAPRTLQQQLDISMQQLDMLYFGMANVTDKKFAGGADPGGLLDSTAAIAAAHAASPYVIYPLGTYKKTGTVAIAGSAHVIFQGANIVQNDNLAAYSANTIGWRISGLGTISRAAGVPVALVASSIGISIGSAAARYGIHGDIVIYNFSGAGVQVDGGGLTATVARSKIDGVTCRNNYNGWVFLTGYSSEYISLTNCFSVDNNSDGVYMESANINWLGGAITGNNVGVHLKHPASGINPHHGSFIGTHINHNILRQLHAENVAFGHDFVGCHFFDNANAATGRIRLENSRGINITGGEIGCGIEGIYDGSNPNYGFNRISNNFFLANGSIITGAGFTREKLIVSGNFDQGGPSFYNDARTTFALKRLSADYAATATVNLGAIGDEIYDNRSLLSGNFVANPGGWFTISVNLNLIFTIAPTTEYIMFGRDDAASGSFTELHRVRVADCATGVNASINASYDFVVSGGGQLTAFIISPGGNNFTVKAGSAVSFKSLS